jgi:hypothetical protein
MHRILVRLRPSPAMVVACTALLFALTGAGYAAGMLGPNTVGTKQLKKNAVISTKVKNRSLLAVDFKAGQLPAGPPGAPGAPGAPGQPGPPGAPNPNADRVNGRRIQCPAGTVEFVSECFESATRAPATVFVASDTCKAAGGTLGDGATLRSGRGGSPLVLAAGGEWTDQIFSADGASFFAMSIANDGGFARVGTLTPTPYRCVFSPVRAIGAGPFAPGQAPATHGNADGS